MKGTEIGYEFRCGRVVTALVVQYDREVGMTIVNADRTKEKLLCLNKKWSLDHGEPEERYYKEFDSITKLLERGTTMLDAEMSEALHDEAGYFSVGIACAFE